jgi:hypothetical protein
MAAIACDLCNDEQAVLMQTSLETGDTMAVGRSCLIPFTLGAAVAFSEGMEQEEQNAYRDLTAALLANIAPSMLQLAKSAVPKPPRKPRAGKADKPAQDGEAITPSVDARSDSERQAGEPAGAPS